eukprot:GHUV01000552.1.p1 GENE.GHUV01000552.1~~GHUV01000552.1.p1  ORF type:complete len:402 (+),score=80.93 GHUV01000552.1:142-1347(+)
MAEVQRPKKQPFLACCFATPQVDDEHGMTSAEAPITAHKEPMVHATAVIASSETCDAPRRSVLPEKVVTLAQISRKSLDQGYSPMSMQHSGPIAEMPNLKPLMAMNLNRPYTDDDWFAAMSAIEKVRKIQQQRALQQLRSHHKFRDPAFEDDTDCWFDARSHTMSDSSVAFISDAERDEVSKLAHELEQQEHQQQQLTVSPSRELEAVTPSCVPNPPLLFAEKGWKYCQVDIKPFCFYWERDSVRSSPFPLPIDEQMGLNSLFQRTHQSIPGMWLRDVDKQMLLHATPTIIAIPGVMNYTEYFNKDHTPASWTLRRDIRVGKTVGQMFMTTDGLLILRVFTYGIFSRAVEWIGEDYIRLEDNGETIVTRQMCKIMADNSIGNQFLIGRKCGKSPPKRHGHA